MEPTDGPVRVPLLVYGDGFDDHAKRGAALVITRISDGVVVHTSHDTVSGVGGAFVFTKASLPPSDYRLVVWVDASSDGSCQKGDVIWSVDESVGDGAIISLGLFPPVSSDPGLCSSFGPSAQEPTK